MYYNFCENPNRVILANAFSLSMLRDASNVVLTKVVTAETVARLLSEHADKVESAIGHADLAMVLTRVLGTDIRPNRVNIKLEPKTDTLIVAQYVGPRLPEGATELPPDARIEFYLVEVL